LSVCEEKKREQKKRLSFERWKEDVAAIGAITNMADANPNADAVDFKDFEAITDVKANNRASPDLRAMMAKWDRKATKVVRENKDAGAVRGIAAIVVFKELELRDAAKTARRVTSEARATMDHKATKGPRDKPDLDFKVTKEWMQQVCKEHRVTLDIKVTLVIKVLQTNLTWDRLGPSFYKF
jgi:hypothetical protein